jgi:hypothetical protein
MRYAYGKDGVWRLEHADPPKPKDEREAIKESGDREEASTAEAGVQLPDILPDHVRDDVELNEVVQEGVGVLRNTINDATDEKLQRIVDIVALFELEAGGDSHPPLWNENAILGMLKQRWGSIYEQRLAGVQELVSQNPKLRDWLNRTGAGNYIPVLEALAAMSDGTMGASPEQAAKIVEEARRDPKGPLRNPTHKDHALAVSRVRVLADLVDRQDKHTEKQRSQRDGGRSEQQALKRGIEAHQASRGNDPKATPDQQRLDDEIRQIRLDKGYSNSSAPNHKQLVARMKELYRLRYSD